MLQYVTPQHYIFASANWDLSSSETSSVRVETPRKQPKKLTAAKEANSGLAAPD